MPKGGFSSGPGRLALAGSLVLALAMTGGAHAATITDSRADRPAASEAASPDARRLAAWVLESEDHQGRPFLIIDKQSARVLAYDSDGALLSSTAALLGAGRGDESPAGIGARPLSGITPGERITPAGRFVASTGVNLSGKPILWVDYESALSLHPVVTARAADRRLERLASATTLDNRISYGCINVPADFYETVVDPLFRTTTGIVYILPETRSVESVFFRAKAADQTGS